MLFALLSLFTVDPAATANALGALRRIPLVDDRGAALLTPVEACFQVELHQVCSELRPSTPLEVPEYVESLTIEGNDYGPFSTRKDALAATLKSTGSLVIPRKGSIRVRAPATITPTVTLYRLDDSELRQPAFRQQLTPQGMIVKVPAGESLVSISHETMAPSLHVIDLEPGGETELRFKPRSGWSLVIRVVESESQRPIPYVDIRLTGVEGFSSSLQATTGRSDVNGLATWSGLEDAVMRARLEHPRFIESAENGILASPGTFAYHKVVMEHGGSIRATILLEGQPVHRAACEVVRYPQRRARGAPPETLSKGLSDRSGTCVSSPLARGDYLFRVSESSRGAKTLHSVTVSEGQQTPVTIGLYPIHVTGSVRLGSRPASGFVVHAQHTNAPIPSAEVRDAVAMATCDEDGNYDLQLWSPGSYTIGLESEQGAPVQRKKLESIVGDQVVDFQLDEATVFGFVTDESGKALAETRVALRWESEAGTNQRLTWPAEDGSFSFPMQTTGPIEIFASKEGYRPSDPLRLRFTAGSALGPLELVLRKEPSLRGSVFRGAGTPIPGAEVTVLAGGSGSRQFRTATSNAEGLFEIDMPAGTIAEGFVGGPGCPLTSFGAPPSDGEWRIACASAPAALAFTLLNENGRPLPDARFILKTQGHVVPANVIMRHQSLFQSPAQTDMSGRLVFIALAPGDYEVYLAGATNETLVASGASIGFLGSYSLAPLHLTEVQAQVGWERTLVEAPK